jgi:FkbM family methyltransferase
MNPVLKGGVRRLARRLGYTIGRYTLSGDVARLRGKLLADLGVDLVLDVGANIGQYGQSLRAGGYTGRILSFEPVPEAFEALSRVARFDGAWACRRLALGDHDGESHIHVNNIVSTSSLLAVGAALRRVAPQFVTVQDERVAVARLDSLGPEGCDGVGRVYLKIDVQGYELPVLEGARACLGTIVAIECELAPTPLYEGQAPFRALIDHLDDLGFQCYHINRGFCDESAGQTLDLDGIFVRRGLERRGG